jgi:hypothetical protein
VVVPLFFIMDIEKYIAHLQNTAPRQEEIVLEVIRRNEPTLVDLNTAQLMEGKDADGEPVKPAYKSEVYAKYKESLNPRGVVDLKLEGDFHNSFYIKAEKFPVTTGARDEKTAKLRGKYGNIFGFTKESKESASDQLGPETIEEIQARIFLV